jgi:hypothetical protein
MLHRNVPSILEQCKSGIEHCVIRPINYALCAPIPLQEKARIFQGRFSLFQAMPYENHCFFRLHTAIPSRSTARTRSDLPLDSNSHSLWE